MLPLLLCLILAQQPVVFDAATVRPSRANIGHDGDLTIDPVRFTAKNATLKRLIYEAWQLPYVQISGPAWLDVNEFDITTTTAAPATRDQQRQMLKALLTERFQMKFHTDTKERRVYELTATKDIAKLRASSENKSATWRLHADMKEFAGRLALLLTIPMPDDPTRPAQATGPPTPVIDKTGLEGTFDIAIDLRPEPGADPFTLWQRALREQLGLQLQARRGPIETLVIDQAASTPTGN